MIEHELVKENTPEAPCNAEGCTEIGFACYLPDTYAGDEPDAYYCSTHAFNAGFCKLCGVFEGGIESFEFGPYAGYCDTCKIEMEQVDKDDDDEDGDDFYDPADDY